MLKFRKITHIVGIKGMSSIVCERRETAYSFVFWVLIWKFTKTRERSSKMHKGNKSFLSFCISPGFQVFAP